jgi:hypothetical protein
MHQSNWGEKENLGDDFSLTKKEAVVWEIDDLDRFDLFWCFRLSCATGIMEYCNI